METLIVTGGAGFIGSNFVRAVLAKTDLRVVVLDKLTYAGCRDSLADLGEPRFLFRQADIADIESVTDAFKRFDPVGLVNFAAETHVDRSIDGPADFVSTNVVGLFVLLEAARNFLPALPPDRRRSFRFLQISTDEVYGSLGATGRFTEDMPYAPNSPYAATKAAGDHLVRAYHATYGLPAFITNTCNNYGPFQFPEKLIPLTILNALEGKPLPIYGDGSNVRDWLFVEDHCEALLEAFRKGEPGEKYNIGGRAERTNVQVVDAICAALEDIVPAKKNPALQAKGVTSYAGLKTFVADRPGHDRRYAIDPIKFERFTGWTARHSFDEGIRKTAQWYVDHRAWCDAVQAGKYERQRLGLGTGS